MRRKVFAALAITALSLWGCNRPALSPDQAGRHGRYAAVGIYGPGQQWTRLIANQKPTDPDAARPIDDQAIIVVQNSVTGEVRACGDLTGYCIGMNPWKAQLLSSQIAPVKVTEHRAPDDPDATVELSVGPDKAHKHQKPREPEKPSDGGDQAGRAGAKPPVN
jgi:hypothetical protein